MLLKDSFYTLHSCKQEENAIHATIEIHSEHPIFKGHFPEQPVTPGVVELEIVQEILQTSLGRKLRLKSLANCKFLNILDPTSSPIVEIQLQFSEEEDSIKVKGIIQDEKQAYLKLVAVYG